MYISTPLINRGPSVFYPETEVSITRLVTRLHMLTLFLVALRATGTHSLVLVFYPETESHSTLQMSNYETCLSLNSAQNT
jgi:hypothetical protein